jgi:cytochrome P450
MFHVMASRPDIQKIAQDEIDSVVGRDRLPAISDRENLPYIRAFAKELLRYHPPAPFGEFFLQYFIRDANNRRKAYLTELLRTMYMTDI